MKGFSGGLLVAFLIIGCGYTYAQAPSSVMRGQVSEEHHHAAVSATIILLAAADSSILKSTMCDKSGRFTFNVHPGNYLILATKIGYDAAYSGPYSVDKDADLVTREINLIESVPQLKEVSINAQRSYVEVKPGRVVLNVQSSIAAEGNSVFEILRQAPGVHLDGQGNISIIGRQNALITIDGKPTNLSGENLTGFLQGMQSSTIQQIELNTNPSAKNEAGAAGIINIVTKKGTNAGSNVTLTAGLGYGKFYKSNVGVVFNNRMDKFNIFGSYNYSDSKTFHTFLTNRFIDYKGITSDYNVDYYATQKSRNHLFRLGTDYYISPKHTLGFLVSGTVNNNDFLKNNTLKIANQSVLDSTIQTNSNLKRNLSNINYDINYNGKLDTTGKTLSADFSFNDIHRSSLEYIDNNFYNALGNTYRSPLYLQNLSPSGIYIWAAKIDYVNPLSKTEQLETGSKYSWVKSNNDLVFGPRVNGQYQSDPRFSNTFIYTENINSAYVNYTKKGNKFDLVAGLRVEETNSKGNSVTLSNNTRKSYTDWFPQAQLNYRYNEKNEFSFSYNRGIQRPYYEDINPFLYYVDLYDYRSGNPNLLPEYSNKIEISHTYNKKLVTTLYATIITDVYDFNLLDQNDSSKVNVTTRRNFGTSYIYGLRFFAPMEFTDWWTGNFSVDASYQRIKAYQQNGDLNKGTQDVLLSSQQSFKISNTITAELSGKYESPTFYGIGQFKATYRVDAGISKQLFNKNGSLKLSVNDIFDTQREWADIKYQNLNLSVIDKFESRIIRLGFTYRFGNISLKGITKHDAGNEEEQKRAGNVAGN